MENNTAIFYPSPEILSSTSDIKCQQLIMSFEKKTKKIITGHKIHAFLWLWTYTIQTYLVCKHFHKYSQNVDMSIPSINQCNLSVMTILIFFKMTSSHTGYIILEWICPNDVHDAHNSFVHVHSMRFHFENNRCAP